MGYIDKWVTFLQGHLYSYHDLLHTHYMGLTLPGHEDISCYEDSTVPFTVKAESLD